MENEQNNNAADINNIYKLDGKIPLNNAMAHAMQHLLAMFVANMTPIVLIAGVAKINGAPIPNEIVPSLILEEQKTVFYKNLF